MKVYRLIIDSTKRQPCGHECDFEWDLSGFTTTRDLRGQTWMVAAEWTDPIRYSEVTLASARILPIPVLSSSHAGRFSSTTHGKALVRCAFFYHLRAAGVRQNGLNGVSADVTYCQEITMGCLVQGGRLT
jgi:hypothetical protein